MIRRRPFKLGKEGKPGHGSEDSYRWPSPVCGRRRAPPEGALQPAQRWLLPQEGVASAAGEGTTGCRNVQPLAKWGTANPLAW